MKIPQERLRIRFVRSGGPGGQNVNKVATKAEARFRLRGADWISMVVRERLQVQQAPRINMRGELVVTSSRFRTRERNLQACLKKIGAMIERARKVPKKRVPTRPTRASKERRLGEKKQRSQRKAGRGWKPGEEL